MAKSSGHFLKAKSHSEAHNSRSELPTYLLPSEYRTPNGRGSEFIKYYDPRELFDQELAKKNKTKARGKRPKYENSVWEIEVNCNEVHTLEDGKRLAQDLEHLLNYTCCSVALHRDEGRIAKNKKTGKLFPVYNYHFHIVFETYKDGIQFARREHNSGIFRNELQDVIANSLSMERGETQADRLKRVAEKLGVSLALVEKQADESFIKYYARINQIAKDKGIENFKARFELKPKKHISSRTYRQVAQEREKLITLTREEVEKLYKEQLDNTQVQMDNLQAEYENLEVENYCLESKNKELNEQKELDTRKIIALENDNAVLQLSSKAQKAQIEQERKKYKEEGDHIAEEYRALQALNKTMHTQEELDKALADLREKYEERIKAQDNEIEKLKAQNSVLSNEKTELNTQKTQAENTIQAQNNEIESLKTKNSVLSNEKNHLKSELNAQKTQAETTIQAQNKEIEKLKAQNSVLSNQPKTVEVEKEVTRPLLTSEIEELPRVKELKKELESTHKYYKELSGAFDFEVSASDLKTKKFGMFSEEKAQDTADRINAEIREQINPIIQNNRALRNDNTVLSNNNEKLKQENEKLKSELKSWQKISLELLQNLGYFLEEKIPPLKTVVDTVKSIGSKLFSGFISRNELALDDIQKHIEHAQELKIEKLDQDQSDLDNAVDNALGYGRHSDYSEREHEYYRGR